MTGLMLEFRFEELPLVVDNGFEAGEVSGSAEIAYHRDGEWCVRGIALDGARRLTPVESEPNGTGPRRFHRRLVALDEGDPLYLRILDRLEHDWAGRVREAVGDEILQVRTTQYDDRHDRRRALAFAR
jgi:hypothetical protein